MKRARIWGGFAVVLGALCLASSTGWADPATIPVVCPGASIQAVIDDPNTQPLDTISVTGSAPCNESVNVTKDNLILTGNGTAQIVSKDQNSPAIKVSGRNVTIDGFDISGGAVGVRVSDLSSANITNNTIHDNAVGILVRESSSAHIGFVHYKDPASQPNTITGNVEGIMVTACSSSSIVGNTIQGNIDNGIVIEKVSQANVAGNLISGNTHNGISLSGNSGVNLAADTPGTIFDLPNYTDISAKNSGYGIACTTGGVASGNQGGLTGVKGAASFASGCINYTTAPPASQYNVVGIWNVDSCSNVTACADVVTFKAGTTQSSGTGTIHFPDNTLLPMTSWSMKGEILTITNIHGTFYGTVTWTDKKHATYNFIEPGRAGTSVMVLHEP